MACEENTKWRPEKDGTRTRDTAEIIADTRVKLRSLADQFGWEIDETGEPHEPMREYAARDYSTMAHIAVAAGAFASVGEAKRNGWNRSPTAGDYRVARTRFRVT